MKKCIILDLDNTLWGGIVGEDGQENLLLSIDGEGASFIAFQQVLKDLYDRGVILAINSRNNFDDAMNVVRTHPDMILKEHHFSAIRVNWQDKATNIIELANELNIGLDSMVFLDDDPTNRSLVRSMIPEVEVPELPASPMEYAKFLIDLPYFPDSAMTNEDKMRGNMYVTERLRQASSKSYENLNEFLNNLELELQISINDRSAITRLSQLTEKTNQFNINKHPLTENEILDMMTSDNYQVIQGRLVDRFGDYGIIILAIIRMEEKNWYIEQLLMSCRVISKGVEETFFTFISRIAKENHVDLLSIDFKPSEKNIPAQDFVSKHFINNRLTLDSQLFSPEWIKVKYEEF